MPGFSALLSEFGAQFACRATGFVPLHFTRRVGTSTIMTDAAPQPLFNRQPAVVVGLCGLIVVAHLVRAFGSYDTNIGLVDALAVVPAAYAGPLDTWNWPPLFGHVFVHGDWIHLAFNVVILLAVSGRVVERMGAVRYLILFFLSALFSALTFVAFNAGSENSAIGASGAVSGIFAAMLMGLRWDWRASISDPQVLRTGAGFLFAVVLVPIGLRYFGVLPIAWEAHLGGFVAGLLLFPLLAPKVGQVR